jgi:Tol biopolymer transport system component
MSYGRELRALDRDGWKQRTLVTFELTRSGGADMEDMEFAWSPDGKRLALIFPKASSLQPNHIYLLNADGSGLEDLGEAAPDPRDLSWSPDGQFLLFTAGAVVYAQDAGGKSGIARDERAVWIWEVEAALMRRAAPLRLTVDHRMINSPDWQPVP